MKLNGVGHRHMNIEHTVAAQAKAREHNHLKFPYVDMAVATAAAAATTTVARARSFKPIRVLWLWSILLSYRKDFYFIKILSFVIVIVACAARVFLLFFSRLFITITFILFLFFVFGQRFSVTSQREVRTKQLLVSQWMMFHLQFKYACLSLSCKCLNYCKVTNVLEFSLKSDSHNNQARWNKTERNKKRSKCLIQYILNNEKKIISKFKYKKKKNQK